MKTQSKKQKAESRKGLGFWLVVLLALVVEMPTPSYGRSHGSVATGLDPTITLRVFNYAGGTTGVIAKAEREAGYVFEQAGVSVLWWDCLAKNAEPGCTGPFGTYDLTLRILPGEPKNEPGLPEDTFGFALFPSAATVYSSRLEAHAASIDATLDYATLLGDVMAHEVGHLLLGPGHHSKTGIMQAHWQEQTLRDGIKRMLHFTPEQANRIRTEVSSRLEFHEDQLARTRTNGNAETSASVK